MRNSATALLFLFAISGFAQDQQPPKNHLSLNDAVAIALRQSNQAMLSDAKVETRGFELATVKNNRYPDVKVSGQYMRLTNADVKLKSSSEASTDPSAEPKSTPKVNQLAFGQAGVTMPIFSGFKLKNSIAASENLYQAQKATAVHEKAQTALEVVELYGDLYKAERSVELFRESLKSNNQRVTEFQDRERNGLIARNDLLKAQLQVSKVQLSLDEAEKNVRLLNYQLVSLLKLPEGTQIEVTPESIDMNVFSKTISTEGEALGNRQDLQALQFDKKAADAQIKVAKSAYYPSLAITGGYIALDMQNVVTVTNAMNVGLGLSYNLSSLFKNDKDVKAAKSRAREVEAQTAMLTDKIKNDIVAARENYDLSLKQAQVYGDAVAQAAENYRIVKDKYDNGLADTNDLLEADVDNLSAQINQAYAKSNVALKFYELLEATGQLTDTFNTKN